MLPPQNIKRRPAHAARQVAKIRCIFTGGFTMHDNFDPSEQPEAFPALYPQTTGSENGCDSNVSPRPAPSAEPASKKRRQKNGFRLAALALCFSLLGSVLGAGGVLLAGDLLSRDTGSDSRQITAMVEGRRNASAIEIVDVDTNRQLTPAQVYAANVNSTVGITTTAVSTNFWGFKTTSAASGSGFILSTDGYILTNYHVIERSDSITVAMYDGTTYPADLIGYDESNDIAVLKIEADNLSPVILGDSDALNVGDSVVAIGNPLGELTFSLTSGAVSAVNREVTLSSSVTMDLIQTDCAINSGNSGGALFNLYGEVVGITNAKYSGSSASQASIDNIGFAIPINSVRSIVDSIITKGYISSPYIGISVLDVSEQTQLYGVPAGIAIQSVTDGGPASQAGLQPGDVITAVNGNALDSDGLVDLVGASTAGDVLTLEIYRQGATLTVSVCVGEQVLSALANEETQQTPSSASHQSQQSSPFGSFGKRR